MDHVEFIPLYNAKAVMAAWPTIVPGMERVIEYSTDCDDLPNVLNGILSGELLLWLLFVDGKYGGFITTTVRVFGTNPPQKVLWIQHTFRDPKCTLDPIKSFMDTVVDFARRNDCDAIRFSTTRAGAMEKRVEDYGFIPVTVEFERRL